MALDRDNNGRPEGETAPDSSLVIPCYNEEESLRATAVSLARSFREREMPMELVLVDNGSTDGTAAVIDALAAEGLPVVKVTVERNRGYGYGVLQGLQAARGRFVGFLCADSQVGAEDVAQCYELARAATTPKMIKVRRRFRMDGLRRKVISIVYNGVANVMFTGLRSIDINGNPKVMPRDALQRMNLVSEDWFLDAEVMIKAKQQDLPVYEMNVMAQMRPEGFSHVRANTCWEFLKNLLRYRFGVGDATANEARRSGTA